MGEPDKKRMKLSSPDKWELSRLQAAGAIGPKEVHEQMDAGEFLLYTRPPPTLTSFFYG